MKLFLHFAFIVFFSGVLSAQILPEKSIDVKGVQFFCLAYSPDGQSLAVGDGSGDVIVFNAKTWTEITRLKGVKGIPISVAFSPDGKKIAAGGKDMKVTIWDYSTYQPIASLKGHKNQIMGLAFSPDGSLLASASHDQKVIVWDLKSNTQKYMLSGHINEVNAVSFSPDGATLVSAGADETIKFWDIKSGTLRKSVKAHEGWIRAVKFSPDGSMVASGGDDRQIQLWDAQSGEKINTFLVHRKWVQTLDFSTDGRYLLSGGHDDLVILTEINTGKVVFQSTKLENYILGVAFNPKGLNFAAISLFSGVIQIWDARNLTIQPVTKTELDEKKSSGFLPVIEWIQPKTETNLSTANVKVSARIKSESSLRSIELYVNNQLYLSRGRSELMLETAETEFTNFDEMVVVPEGVTTLQLKVRNIAGETASEPVKIKFSNNLLPLMTWVNPAQNNLETNLTTYELKTIINPAPSAQSIEILVNGIKQITVSVPAEGGLLTQPIKLQQGLNTLKLIVTTSAFTRETEPRQILQVKANKPIISMLSPLNDTVCYVSTVRIKALVESEVPIDKVQIKINGLSVYNKLKPAGLQYYIDQQIQLSQGKNVISIQASNNSGETISEPVSIVFEQANRTLLSWLNPTADTNVFQPNLTIKACVQSKQPISKIEMYNNGGIMFTEQNPQSVSRDVCQVAISKMIYIGPGKNNLHFVAYHADGKTDSEIRTIDFIIPQPASISWIYPTTIQNTTSENTYNIKACVRSNSKVTALSVLVNNQVFTKELNPVPSPDGCYNLEQTVLLASGVNTVLVRAQNQSGDAMSIPVTVEYKKANPYRYALIIGNEDYSSYQTDLESESDVDYAINDAKAFKELCIKKLNIPAENIFYKENARFIEMRTYLKRMSQFIENSNGNAEVFVYYAGHGFPDEKTKEPYLVPVDGNGTDLEITAIKLTDFYAAFTTHQAKRVTVFIDACFSGGARNQGLVAARGVKITPIEEKAAVQKRLVVFTASSGNESSLPYKDKEHGIFTYYLLEKINATSGKLSYQELSDYINQNVSNQSIRVNGKPQHPQTNFSPEVASEWANWNIFE